LAIYGGKHRGKKRGKAGRLLVTINKHTSVTDKKGDGRPARTTEKRRQEKKQKVNGPYVREEYRKV